MAKTNPTRYKQILDNSKTIFAGVTQMVRDAILITDSSGDILFLNQSFEVLTGYTSEIIGSNFGDLFPSDEASLKLKILGIRPNSEVSQTIVSQVITRYGLEKTFILTIKAIRVWNRRIITIILNKPVEPQPESQEIILKLQERISTLQQEIGLLQAYQAKLDDELTLSRQGQSALKMTNQLLQTRLGELDHEISRSKESLAEYSNRCQQHEKTILNLEEQIKTAAVQHQEELGRLSDAAHKEQQKAGEECSSHLHTLTEQRAKLAQIEDHLATALLDKKQFLEDFHLLLGTSAAVNSNSTGGDGEDNPG